jgi:hypothetical protein
MLSCLSLVIVSLMWQESRKSVTGSHGKTAEFVWNFSGKVTKDA